MLFLCYSYAMCEPNLTNIYHTEIIFQQIQKLFSSHVGIPKRKGTIQ